MLAKLAYASVYFSRIAAVTGSPPCLQRIEATQNSTSLSNFSDTSAEQSIEITFIYVNMVTPSLPLFHGKLARHRKAKTPRGDTVRRWLPNDNCWRQKFQITCRSQLSLLTVDRPGCRQCVRLRVHPKAAAQLLSLLCRRALATILCAAFPDLGLPEHWSR
jgi:hypothetical protein